MTIEIPGLPALHWTGAAGTAAFNEDTTVLTLDAASIRLEDASLHSLRDLS